jgi:hypothetical protein
MKNFDNCEEYLAREKLPQRVFFIKSNSKMGISFHYI